MSRVMKDSGIEWIGDIPASWDMSRLLWCLEEIKEKNNPIQTTNVLSLTNKLGVVPYEERGNQGNKAKEDYSQYGLAFENTLVINSMNVLIGSVGISKYFGCVSPVYYVFKNTDKADLRYINYVFQNTGFQKELRKYANGILEIRLRISSHDMLRRMIPLPTLQEQNRISDYLDSECARIDAVIEQTRASIEEYKKLKQSVISQAVTKGIRQNRKMKDSGIEWVGAMPEDWKSINPKALFTQRKEKASAGERQLTASQQYGVIFQDEYMERTGTKIVTVEKDFDILKHVETGDFVISMRSFQGGLEYSTNTGSISSAYVMLIPNLDKVYPRFYRWLLKSSVYINAIQSTTNMVRDGQAMRYANFIQVRLYDVPLDEQEEIANYLDGKCLAIDELIRQKESLLNEMEAYKKSFIFEYVTGKKEVPA